jgi:hypothetical protein
MHTQSCWEAHIHSGSRGQKWATKGHLPAPSAPQAHPICSCSDVRHLPRLPTPPGAWARVPILASRHTQKAAPSSIPRLVRTPLAPPLALLPFMTLTKH